MLWCNVTISIIFLNVCIATSSCALDHYSLPNNVLVNQCDMLRFILWGLIGYPSFVYPTPCKQMNYWVDLLLLYLVLGLILYLN
jgi:hypothetical protein